MKTPFFLFLVVGLFLTSFGLCHANEKVNAARKELVEVIRSDSPRLGIFTAALNRLWNTEPGGKKALAELIADDNQALEYIVKTVLNMKYDEEPDYRRLENKFGKNRLFVNSLETAGTSDLVKLAHDSPVDARELKKNAF